MNFRKKLNTVLRTRISRWLKDPAYPLVGPPGPADDAEAIRLLHYSDLSFTSPNRVAAFRSCVRMVSFALHTGCKNVLEIGAGLSTAIWADYAKTTGAHVSAIDADFSAMDELLGDSEHATTIKQNVELIQGATLKSSDLTNFFTEEPTTSYAGVPVSSFADCLDFFRDSMRVSGMDDRIDAYAGTKAWKISDLILRNSALVLPRPLVDIFAIGENLDAEIRWFDRMGDQGLSGILDNLVANRTNWDLIFFDSGELASIIEWISLKDHISIGGLAAFHDIFFPKSFKNFIVCASLLVNPDWKIVFIDSSNKQGLMLAQRLR